MTRQQVGTGSRAPGRRLSVERVPGSSGRMKEGLGGWGDRRNFYSGSREAGITPSPQCGTTPAFQLKCMLRREKHNLCSGYTYRTIHVLGMICCTCKQECTQWTRLTRIVILRGIIRPCRLAIPRCIIHLSCTPLRGLTCSAILHPQGDANLALM